MRQVIMATVNQHSSKKYIKLPQKGVAMCHMRAGIANVEQNTNMNSLRTNVQKMYKKAVKLHM